MSTPSRSRTMAGLLAVGALLALAVSPVAAKEGAIAKLDTFVHRDAEPGSTIKVGWSTFMLAAGGEHPIHSTVETMRLIGPDGDSTEAIGVETPRDSGHYRVSMTVPVGGIEQIQLSVRGDACTDSAGCERVDYAFPLTDDALVSGTPVGIAKPAASVMPVTPVTPPAPESTSVSSGLGPLVAIGVAIALAGGLAALIVTRRRHVGIEAAGR